MPVDAPLPSLILGARPTWQMPELPSLNKLSAHATFWPFPDPAQAVARYPEHSPLVRVLNGTWDFALFDSPYEVTAAAIAQATWRPLDVPGNWTMQLRNESWHGESFNKPHYTNIQMPFAEPFPHVPAAIATGVYRTRIQVPTQWDGQRIVIHFSGCEGMLAVYLDGTFIGFNKDSRTPAEYDLSAHVRAGGTYELLCVNPRYSDASWVEDQDHWWQAGIHRDVYLYATPGTYLQDVVIHNDFNDDLSEVTVRMTATVRSQTGQPQGTIRMHLLDPDGQRLGDVAIESAVPGTPQGFSFEKGHVDTARVTLATTVVRPLLWNPETPHLYTVVVTLEAADQSTSTAIRIGFRHVEISNREVRVNRRAIMVHGVNYHEHHDEFGKAVPRSTMELDIRTMKAHNINAVRTSHYPNNPYWLDLCDEYGMFVVDEANIEHHALLALADDPRVSTAYLERTKALVARDRNHPCVIIWSLGNESGCGINHEITAAWLRTTDPSRPIQYEGAMSPFFNDQSISLAGFMNHWKRGRSVTDIVCPMYASIDDIVTWVTQSDDPRPLILCEYAHAMGNSTGSLSDYYAAFEQHHGLQGGFIWEWLDHGIKQRAADGTPYWVYGGGFGDFPNDGNFVADGMVWPDRTPHPGMREFMYLARPVRMTAIDALQGHFRIENRRLYTDLQDLVATWHVRVDGGIVAQGEFAIPALAPQTGADIELPIAWPAHGECFVDFSFMTRHATAWAPAGSVVAWDQLAGPNRAIVNTPASATSCHAQTNGTSITLSNGAHHVQFDARTGHITNWGDHAALLAGPQLDLWRALTDNDKLQDMFHITDRAVPLWRRIGLLNFTQRVDAVTVSTQPDGHHCVVVHVSGTGRDQWDDVRAHHTYTMLADGTLHIATVVNLSEEFTDLPRIGLHLQLAPAYEQLSWYGRGPIDSYTDRAVSSPIGIYHSTVSDQYVPYIKPQEHGHKTDVRWLRLSDGHGRGIEVRSHRTFEFNALHHTSADLEQAKYTIDLPRRAEVFLNLDYGMRGLGTGLMVDTLPQYRLNERTYHFAFWVRPL